MKRNSFYLISLTVLFLGLFQNCIDLTRDRVYYDKYFHIYISVKQESGYCDIRLGKSLSNLDNKLLFSNISEMAIFSIIPKNDTIYIYDEDYWVTETSNGSLILKKVNWCPKDSAFFEGKWRYIDYHFEDSTALLSTPYKIVFYNDWHVTPYFWNGSFAEKIERIK